jgi:hypothetical protein
MILVSSAGLVLRSCKIGRLIVTFASKVTMSRRVMSHTIEIDDEVYARLRDAAEPFVDTPNSVLRRLLLLDQAVSPGRMPVSLQAKVTEHVAAAPDGARSGQTAREGARGAATRHSKRNKGTGRTRAASGSILPEEEYEIPLLQSLVDAGGSGPSREIIEAVGKRLDSRLTDVDREPLSSGAIRWENRIQFVRLKLIERGWMLRDTSRGTWAISDEGRKQIEEGVK